MEEYRHFRSRLSSTDRQRHHDVMVSAGKYANTLPQIMAPDTSGNSDSDSDATMSVQLTESDAYSSEMENIEVGSTWTVDADCEHSAEAGSLNSASCQVSVDAPAAPDVMSVKEESTPEPTQLPLRLVTAGDGNRAQMKPDPDASHEGDCGRGHDVSNDSDAGSCEIVERDASVKPVVTILDDDDESVKQKEYGTCVKIS